MKDNIWCKYTVKETVNGYRVESFAKVGEVELGHASITFTEHTFTIVQWSVHHEHRNSGIGRELLRILIEIVYSRIGVPEEVIYEWNGVNSYVYDWLKRNFEAECSEDIAVMKYDFSDSKAAHEYRLNPELVLKYFGVR